MIRVPFLCMVDASSSYALMGGFLLIQGDAFS